MSDDPIQVQNPNVIFYSDTFVSSRSGPVDRLEGIKTKLASLHIGTGKEDDIKPYRVIFWQQWADQRINSMLAPVYLTPLIRITRTGRNLNAANTPVPFFPDPIQSLAIDYVAAQMVLVEYTDVDPNTNEAANALMLAADKTLKEIAGYDGIVGSTFLEGQQARSRHLFAPPNAMPRNIPKIG
jgi:hypothetical protein